MMLKDDWKTRAVMYFQRLGKPRPKAYYRCALPCRTRIVLRKELWEYQRPPKCPCCKEINWQLDLSRSDDQKNKKNGYAVCNCDGTHYPVHKPDSVKLCIYYEEKIPGFDNEHTQLEFEGDPF